MGSVIDFQHIFHGGHERGVAIRRNDELLFQVRLKEVFFSVRPIVLSLARPTMFNSTTLSSSRRNVHRACPFGGSEQARAINLASLAPSKIRGLADAGECQARTGIRRCTEDERPADDPAELRAGGVTGQSLEERFMDIVGHSASTMPALDWLSG